MSAPLHDVVPKTVGEPIRAATSFLVAWLVALFPFGAWADAQTSPLPSDETPKSDSPEPHDVVASARELFVEGTGWVKSSDWAPALSAFERSASLVPHPFTTQNIGICQRALGQYTRARKSFRLAISQNKGEMPPSLINDIRGYVDQINGLLATVSIVLEPPDAAIIFDGRPLEVQTPGGKDGNRPLLVAGTLPPGPGRRPPASRFDVVVDPGVHVITLSRPGFADIALNRSFGAGSRSRLQLILSRLPAHLNVDANIAGAVVTVNGLDVGVVPVRVNRPPGVYSVLVRKPDYVSHASTIRLKPGERTQLNAKLHKPEPGLASKWWFWSAVGAVLVGAAATTYLATRPEPERPPIQSGGLWTLQVE